MTFTGIGWYTLMIDEDCNCSDALTQWGLAASDINEQIYKLNKAITHGETITNSHWDAIDITSTIILQKDYAYWVYVKNINIAHLAQTFINITTDVDYLNDDIQLVKNILNDIIHIADKPIYNINVVVDDTLSSTDLGWAAWSIGQIGLNPVNKNKKQFLNNELINSNVIILLHEILHIFGIGGGSKWYGLINDDNGSPKNVYNGSKAVAMYKKILEEKNYDISSMEDYIPIENNFGYGTEHVHLEEGKSETWMNESRKINNIIYPSFPYEIMTGFINRKSYISSITLGILEDLGFDVNYESKFINNTLGFMK